MAINIKIPPYRLSNPQKKTLTAYLQGQLTLKGTAQALGVTQQMLYRMVTSMTRHASSTGQINVKELLKNY